MHIISQNRGFIAMISTMIVASGLLVFSLSTLTSAVMYLDMVNRREIRTQVELNLSSCMNIADLMIGADYFLSGTMTISELGCTLHFSNDFAGHVSVGAIAELLGVIVKVNE
ncbi:MAG: hypothetical protein WCP09_02775 [Candidatus Taylorbacteria bacterium]